MNVLTDEQKYFMEMILAGLTLDTIAIIFRTDKQGINKKYKTLLAKTKAKNRAALTQMARNLKDNRIIYT